MQVVIKIFFITIPCFFTIPLSFSQTTDSIPTIDSVQIMDVMPTVDDIQTTDAISFTDTSSHNSIHYKGSVIINIGEQAITTGQFNLVNRIDSFLYIQLHVAGFEAGRILLTPDQILLINKLQKNYYKGDYAVFQHLIDVEIDFYTLQAIFNGAPTVIPEGAVLVYEGEQDSFFNKLKLIFESLDYALKLELDVKKVTFNEVPHVSATVPKNFTAIKFYEEN